MVVRNPFDRMVSEFNYFNKIKNLSVKNFNHRLSKEIIKNSRNEQGHHYSPQHTYCEGIIEPHVLKYESLEEDFSKLMGTYNINLNLSQRKNSASYWQKVRSSKIFTTKDLSPGTIRIIIKHYEQDFEEFNYNTEVIE